MLNLSHKSLDVWKISMEFTSTIFKLTSRFPSEERFGLAAHCRKTATSIVSNIAEGASRKSSADRRSFYRIARSSLVELDTQLELALNLGFIHTTSVVNIEKRLLRIFKMLSVLINRTGD